MVLLLDTNLLVLLIVGSASRSFVEMHKRTRAYTLDDFDRLTTHVSGARSLLTTPNILSEASNLSRQIREPARTAIGGALRRFVELSAEVHVESSTATAHHAYLRLGLTDAGVMHALGTGATLLTDDLDLYIASARAGHRAVNFSHGRA